MNELEELYAKAPRLDSPSALDDRVLRAANARKASPPVKVRSNSRWWTAGYAVSYLCVFGIGLGVLLQSGFFPLGQTGGSQFDVVQLDGGLADDVQQSLPSAEPAVVETTVAEVAQVGISESQSRSAAADLYIPEEEGSRVASRIAANKSISANSEAMLIEPEVMATEQVIIASDTAGASADIDLAEQSPTALSSASVAPEIADAAKRQTRLPHESTVADTLTARRESVASVVEAPVASDIVADQAGVNTLSSVGRAIKNSRSLQWLRNQNADNYTVQLAVAGTESDLSQLADGLSISTDLLQINTTAQGWVLLHGGFSEREAAQQVANELLSMITTTPQVLRFEELQRLAE